jgi:glycosyltransferase involved in cell wall biosynthesis
MDKQLGAYYSMLDVFVLPSINNTEAFGMVQVEAMYCETPVIATDLPGVRVPIQETGMGEIIQPQNISTLAGAILKVLQNKKKYVKEKSTIQKIFSAEKILEAYQDVLK